MHSAHCLRASHAATEVGGALWPNLDALGSAPDDEAPEPAKDAGDDEEDLGSSEEEEELAPEKESRLVRICIGCSVLYCCASHPPSHSTMTPIAPISVTHRAGLSWRW